MAMTDLQKVRAALEVVLDQVDYTRGACSVTEPVGGVLDKLVITMARQVLKATKEQG
jgi:hypothetical protein